MKFTTYRTVADVPPNVLIQLKKLCYMPYLGFMRSILDHPKPHLVRYVTTLSEASTVVGWSVLEGKSAHVWVDRPHRSKGLAPKILGHMLKEMPFYRQAKVKMKAKKTQSLLDIGRYLYYNQLLS